MAIGLVAVGAGCGGGSANEDKRDAETAYEAFVQAYAVGDGTTACRLMTDRAASRIVRLGRERLGKSNCAAAITDAVRGLPADQRRAHAAAMRGIEVEEVHVADEVARLRVTLSQPSPFEGKARPRASSARLVKVRGAWRVDVLSR